MHDIIIIGGGPAGLTAALYARRAGKTVLLLEKEGFGGQLALSPRVENYPGVAAVSGAELAERMLEQVLALDADTDVCAAVGITGEPGARQVLTEDGQALPARSVILAAGVRHRQLGLKGEAALLGRGLSYCAVCDGGFYAGRDVAVVGGGDSALQEALLLSDVCRSVTVIHRREDFRAEQSLQQRLFRRANVRRLTPVVPTALLETAGELRGLTLRDLRDGGETQLAVDALFVAVGLQPDNAAFSPLIALTGQGYADAGEDGVTAAPGIFAAGDCREKAVRQVATAVSDGACAALSACRWLDSLAT